MSEASVDPFATQQLPLHVDPGQLVRAARQFQLRLVVLYGSYTTRRAGPESDLDIAVLGCPAENFWECYRTLSELFRLYTLDLVRIEDADALFREEIMRDAVLLYGDPYQFCEYRAYAYRDFTDSADLLALEKALCRKKMDRLREQLYGSP